MFEDLLNDLWILNASDDLHLSPALLTLLTLLYLNADGRPDEHPFQALRPAHRISCRPGFVRLMLNACRPGRYRYKLCAAESARTETLTVNLEPDEEYESLILWFNDSDTTCSKVLDVEFDETFIPEQC